MSVKSVKNSQVVYGLTGGIATGKSTACKYLIKHKFKVFDADAVVAKLWTNKILKDVILKEYNINITARDGKDSLARLMFSDSKIKQAVEDLIHPLVFDAIEVWIKGNKDEKVLIIDMPLLFEVGYDELVSKTVLIYTTKKIQLRRLMERNSLNIDEANLKIASQLDIEIKKNRADIIIDNSKSKSNLYKQLDKLMEDLLNED